MTQSQPSRTQAPGLCTTSQPTAPCAAEARAREPAQGAGEVHVWFASPSATSRYLDIVLARRSPPSRS